MKIRIELTVAVDPEEWYETYGTSSDEAGIRDEVRRWATNAITHHPDGIVELMTVR